MAKPLELAADKLTAIARQVARHPTTDLTFKLNPRSRRLAEHFELWNLTDLDAVGQLNAAKTDYLHHQIRVQGKAIQFARSVRVDTGAIPEVEAVFTSRLARRIDQAIQWLDDHDDTGDEHVRLLCVPSRWVHAFWLHGEATDRLLLVEKPRALRLPLYKRLYEIEDFVNALRRGAEVVGA